MIKFEQTGKIFKKDGEPHLPTEYKVSLSITGLTLNNIDEKVAELIIEANQIKSILAAQIISTK